MSSPSKFVSSEDGYSNGGESDSPLKELKRLINTLTHTGEKSLDSSVLKNITKICKQSNSYIVHAYHLLMEQLEANHSEIRYSAFQICIELFRRSHCFRELLVSNLQHVMILTAETDPMRCMPPPKSTANMLKKLTLVTVRDWANNYGSGYKKLHHGISYLKNCKKVDFNAMAMEENAERSRQEELKRRKVALQNERFRKMAEEIKEVQPDIINSLTELENCISLVLPRPEDLFVQDECTSAPETEQSREHDKQHTSISNSDSSSECDSDHEQHTEPVFDFRKYGIVNPLFRITLNLNADGAPLIERTEENAAILSTAQELYRLISNKHQPCIIKWETVLEKCSELDASVTSDVSKKVSDLKSRVEASLDKYRRLNLHSASDTHVQGNDDDTSDSDFEEVQNKAGYEAFSKSAPVESQIEGKDHDLSSAVASPSKQASSKPGWSLISDENNVKDPTSVLSTLSSASSSKKRPSPPTQEKKAASTASASGSGSGCSSTSGSSSGSRPRDVQDSQPGPSRHQKRKDKLLAVAPKVPFDVDLYHWEDEKIEAPTLFTLKPDGHRFWVSTAEERDEMRDPDGEANLRTRVIEFSGTFRPVEWTCRAPLASGKLCPRQDREKCPFHGKIIGRDKTGKPSSGEDQQAEEERQHLEKLNQVPDWQDPKLLAELKEKTGVDLRMPDKTKRGWRKHIPGQEPEKKYVGLTDIKAMHNTTYSRLSKKVFQKSAMKRVASAMDKLDRKRFRDKYGDQFNYVFDHS